MAKKEIQVLIIEQKILSKIFILRGEKVMLDRDLAELYGVEPRRLREQVKRNIERFPSKFMFQLKGKEVDDMVSQNGIPSKQYLGGALPYAFTEHGFLNNWFTSATIKQSNLSLSVKGIPKIDLIS